jgi:UDP-N-acetylmuramoylalanine--D-glutamate ligase
MTYREYFKNKKITVMGLGLLGRGIGDIRFLAKHGAELIVTDLKSEAELAESLKELVDLPGITYHLGGHNFADFENRDLILKASGVPFDSPFIAHAQKNNVPIAMSIALFAKFFRGPVVGVTGSVGKTTTTFMISHILKEAGIKHVVAGNVRGGSTLSLLDTITDDTVAVLEIDSWSLQGFGYEKLSPHVAVFTAFVPDHMNYYRGDMDAYFADKANIFLYQHPEDTLVCAPSVIERVRTNYAKAVRARLVVAEIPARFAKVPLLVPGAHSRSNAACAAFAAEALGVECEVAWKALETFAGAPDRLEYIGEKNGVRIYNDTAATTPLAAAAALNALDPEGIKKVVGIIGGSGKNVPLDPLIAAIHAHAHTLIVLPGTGTDELLPHITDVPCIPASSLEEAVKHALVHARPGDVITLSPGFASFGLFTNMYDRGDQFRRLIKSVL